MDSTGKALQLTQGTGLGDYTAASTGALLGTTLAEKNGLSVGSTFTIEDQTFTVQGLFDAGTAFGNNALYVTLPTAQTLAALPGRTLHHDRHGQQHGKRRRRQDRPAGGARLRQGRRHPGPAEP